MTRPDDRPLSLDDLSDDEVHDLFERPQTRAECPSRDSDGVRRCPWMGCRHHLAVEVSRSGRVRIHAEADPTEPDGPRCGYTCALDVVDEEGVSTLESIGALFGISRERTRQIEEAALDTLNAVVGDKQEIADLVDATACNAPTSAGEVSQIVGKAPRTPFIGLGRVGQENLKRHHKRMFGDVGWQARKGEPVPPTPIKEEPPQPQAPAPEEETVPRCDTPETKQELNWRHAGPARRLEMLREGAGLSTTDVQLRTGLHAGVIARVEKGSAGIDTPTGQRLLAAYGITRAQLEGAALLTLNVDALPDPDPKHKHRGGRPPTNLSEIGWAKKSRARWVELSPGERARVLRVERAVPTRRLLEATGVSKSQYYYWERNKRRLDDDLVGVVAEVLGVEEHELTLAPPPTPAPEHVPETLSLTQYAPLSLPREPLQRVLIGWVADSDGAASRAAALLLEEGAAILRRDVATKLQAAVGAHAARAGVDAPTLEMS